MYEQAACPDFIPTNIPCFNYIFVTDLIVRPFIILNYLLITVNCHIPGMISGHIMRFCALFTKASFTSL